MSSIDDFDFSPLERVESAHMACRMAWLYPAEDEFREHAVHACAAVNMSYIDLVAETMENSTEQPELVDSPMLDPDKARLKVAESFRVLAMKMYAAGAELRREPFDDNDNPFDDDEEVYA